ncbi:hypothetical protein [Neisseria bergeri]|uniref:hypothetical protein n=1 Tax=Neisseria bergeri TaxID=1906581 RepID=UPI0027E0089C|nr:hypothetical protein [Neisseria bergeri]
MPSETRMQTVFCVSDGIARYGRYRGNGASVLIGTCPILCPYGGFKQGFPLRRFGLPCLNLLCRNTFPFCL